MEKVIPKVGFDRGIKMGEGGGLLFLVEVNRNVDFWAKKSGHGLSREGQE